MELNAFKKKPIKVESENCRIKIKKMPDGSKTIEFKGRCNREQIEIARQNMGENLE